MSELALLMAQVKDHVADASAVWRRRSKMQWVVDVSSVLNGG